MYNNPMNDTLTPTTPCATCGHDKSEHDYHGDCDWQDGFESCDCTEYVASGATTLTLIQDLKD